MNTDKAPQNNSRNKRVSSIFCRIPAIIDYIIGKSIILVLSFVWCRYYLNRLIDAVMFSLMITLAVVAVFDIMLKRTPKSVAKAERIAAVKALSDTLLYSDPTIIIQALMKIFQARHEVKAHEADNNIILLGGGDAPLKAIYTYFSPTKLSPNDAAMIVKRLLPLNPDSITILTCGFLPSALTYTRRLINPQVKLMEQSHLYNILESYGAALKIPPPDLRPEIEPKPTMSMLFASAFERKRAKGYLLASITMVIASFFIRFSLYYRIFASVFLILALLCLKGPSAKKTEALDII